MVNWTGLLSHVGLALPEALNDLVDRWRGFGLLNTGTPPQKKVAAGVRYASCVMWWKHNRASVSLRVSMQVGGEEQPAQSKPGS